jgi:hypothetical protein
VISDLMNRPCTLLLRTSTGEDAYGNATVTEMSVATVCAFQKQSSSVDAEDRSQNNLAESGWDLFLPFGPDINSGDAVIVDDLEYEVDGDPWPVRNELTGEFSHVEAVCRRVSGSEDGEAGS